MDINKDNNILKYLKDKYGEEVVRLVRVWENTIKKMADIRNYRCFTLRCIKARLTPVSCKLKVHFSSKQLNVIKSFTRQKDNCCMTESEAETIY